MMRANLRYSLLLAVLTCAAVPAFGQATRTWVSGVGDDANPCSRTAPCKTFAGAVSKTAAGGEIDVLDPGGFGAVTITKALTIDGTVYGGVLVAGTNGIVVQAGLTDTVVLRRLAINGNGTGINGVRFSSGAALHIENCTISQFSSRGISAETAGVLIVDNTVVRKIGTIGVVLLPATGRLDATLLNVRSDQNAQHGVYVGSGTRALLRNSTFSSNGNVAVYVDASTGATEATLDNCALFGSPFGLYAGSGPSVSRISNVTITDNNQGIYFNGGSVVSFGNNHIAGNAAGNGPVTNIGPQ